MKKHFNNNNGSTLILLVMAIAIISLLGTSILGVTMMNLKIKITNSEIKQSFYLSESGLDKAYDRSYSHVLAAVDYANNEAKDFIEQFKPENIDSIISDSYLSNYVIDAGDDTYYFDEEEILLEAKNIFETEYKDFIINGNGVDEDDIIQILTDNYDVDDGILEINISDATPIPLSFDGDVLTIGIESDYTSSDNINKITTVDLTISVPEYNEPYTVTTKVIPVNPFWTKVLSAENLIINGTGDSDADDGLKVQKGDTYISNNIKVGGTELEPKFNGDLAVKKDIVMNGSNSTINVSDVYSQNIFLNGDGSSFKTIGDGKNIYVKDDLEINNKNQNIYIDGAYYGFSDGRDNPTPDNSSGININDPTNLQLTITDDVYLFGTSYVKVTDAVKYQTGESLSILGNYRAYMEPLTLSSAKTSDGKDLREGNIIFDYYDYVRFADSFASGSELNAMYKADYIYHYNDEYGGLTIPSNIRLASESGNIYAIGSTISSNNLNRATYTIDGHIEDIFESASSKYDEETNLSFSDEIKFDELPENIGPTGGSELVYINKNGGTYNLSGTYKGLIVTNGDIKITGSLDFTGSIICKGDIIIDDEENKEFKYDKTLVAKIISDYNLHKIIFESDSSSDTISITTYSSGDDAVNIDFSRLMNFKKWNIK